MKDNPKIMLDQNKVGKATELLKRITQDTIAFEKVYKELTDVEQNAVGGILIALFSPAINVSLIASISTLYLAIGLMNDISGRVNGRLQQTRQAQRQESTPNITKIEGDGLPN